MTRWSAVAPLFVGALTLGIDGQEQHLQVAPSPIGEQLPGTESCTSQLAQRVLAISGVDGKSYMAGEGIEVLGDQLTLHHLSGTSVVNKCNDPFGPWDLTQLRLLNRKLSFTVDLSKVGCACNVALYLISAPARDRDGVPIPGNSTLSPGTYYCDANRVGGQWCPEVDIMEANNHAFQATPHTCDDPVGDRYYESCDRNGCAQNTKYQANSYGPGSGFKINTLQPFQVTTSFSAEGSTFTGMTTSIEQEGNQVVLDHSNCEAGYLQRLSTPLAAGMTLRITYWGQNASTMAWMDAPPCGEEVCSGESAGDAVITGIAIRGPEPPEFPEPSPTYSPWSSLATTPAPVATPLPLAPGASSAPRFQCDSGMLGTQGRWSPARKAWCCHYADRGCDYGLPRQGPIRWSNHPDKCLTVAHGSTDNGNDLVLWDCEGDHGGVAQRFVSGEGRTIRWEAHPNICIDVRMRKEQNGTAIQMWDCGTADKDQAFSYPSADTKLRWSNHPLMCLDISNHDSSNGNPIQLWSCLQEDDDQVFTWAVGSLSRSTAAAPTYFPVVTTVMVTHPPAMPVTSTTKTPVAWATTMSVMAQTYDCASGDGDLWSYRHKLWCCRFKQKGCPVRIPSLWVYDPVVAYPLHIRTQPNITGPKSTDLLRPGDVFRVSEGRESADRILYLRLADGRGWVFDVMPNVGTMCRVHRPVASTTSAPYRCDVWFRGNEDKWSFERREYCCNHFQRGCWKPSNVESITLHRPMEDQQSGPWDDPSVVKYNCDVGFEQWRVRWDADQSSWCCLHRGVGCPSTKNSFAEQELQQQQQQQPQQQVARSATDCLGRSRWPGQPGQPASSECGGLIAKFNASAGAFQRSPAVAGLAAVVVTASLAGAVGILAAFRSRPHHMATAETEVQAPLAIFREEQ